MSLNPKDPNGGTCKVKYVKSVGSKRCFFQCVESMFKGSIEENFFFQRVKYVCNILAKIDFSRWLSHDDYDKIFLCRPATIVLYDYEITYSYLSTRLNKLTTE